MVYLVAPQLVELNLQRLDDERAPDLKIAVQRLLSGGRVDFACRCARTIPPHAAPPPVRLNV